MMTLASQLETVAGKKVRLQTLIRLNTTAWPQSLIPCSGILKHRETTLTTP